MASQAHFSRMPSINIPRTKMKMPYKVSTSFQHGYLVPLDAIPVVPGDTFKLKLNSLIRMSNPIRPIMGDIQVDIHAFFVPMRLVWEHTEEFFGENKESAGPQKTLYTIPQAQWTQATTDERKAAMDVSVPAYFGKPIMSKYVAGSGSPYETLVSCLKERCYMLIWNSWYRAGQVENPYLIGSDGDVEENGIIGSRNGVDIDYQVMPLAKVNKKFDYFTSATMSPQFGDAVELALGDDAPVEFKPVEDVYDVDTQPVFKSLDGSKANYDAVLVQPNYQYEQGKYHNFIAGQSYESDWQDFQGFYGSVGSEGDDPGNALAYDPAGTLVAKLNQATMVNVNELRYAFALQKWLERSNFTSGRYFELLQAHYGVSSPDARLQRPEHIGSTSFRINISQVLSTAGSSNDSTTKVGEPGANSVTIDVSNLFTKGFVEFGYVVILLDTKHDRSYGQGLLREDSYKDRFDFYSPEFANLGDQAILNKELFIGKQVENDGTTPGKNDKVFGYQEHWAEMRYRPSRTTGLLNPAASSSLNFWTLADHYANLPELSEDFLFEDRDSIARCLVSGENGPDYIADFYFDLTAVRPMPAYTIPGLIDHFGAL